MSDPLAELVVEKYAEARGEDPAKARERLLPVLTARRPSRLDRAAEMLASLADLLGKVREAGKDMPDQVKTPLTTLAAAAVGAALGAEDEDPVEEGVKGAAKYIAQVKAIDRAFGSDEEARTLRAEIAELRKMVAELQEARRKEEAQKLVEEIQGLIKPLEERLAALEEARKGGEPPPQPPSAEDIIAQVNKVKGEAEKLLEGMGYRVEPGGVTKEEVQRMIEAAREEALSKLPPEELKKRLEAMGYRVEGGPITWEQVQRMVEEARRRAYEEALEDKRIEAVERTVSNAFSQIAQIFQPAVSVIFGVPPAAGAAQAGLAAAGSQAAEGGGEASRRQAEPSQAREGTA